MTQQRLFMTATGLTIVLGVLFFSATTGVHSANAKANPQSPSSTISPCLEPSHQPGDFFATVCVSPAPTSLVSPSASPKPSPTASPIAVGKVIQTWQVKWKDTQNVSIPVGVASNQKKSNNSSSSSGGGGGRAVVGAAAGAAVVGAGLTAAGAAGAIGVSTSGLLATGATAGAGTIAGSSILIGSVAIPVLIPAAVVGTLIAFLFFDGSAKPPNPVQTCIVQKYSLKKDAGGNKQMAAWKKYAKAENIEFNNNGESLSGKEDDRDKNYLISNVFASTEEGSDTALWKSLEMFYNQPDKGSISVSYRISDETGTTDPNDKSWAQLADPDSVAKKCSDKVQIATYNLNKTGKFFQYMVKLRPKQQFRAIWFTMQPLKAVASTTTPGPTPTPTPTISANPAGEGKITIITKKLELPTASPTPHALLPSLAPSASPTAKAVTNNPNCFSKESTSEAANVPFSLRQVDGEKKLEDQQTDDGGSWRGLDNQAVDTFPVGDYSLKIGDFQKNDYKLVDICVLPADGAHIKKTETNLGNGRAVISVTKDAETKVTLLYSLRNKPYISMNTFAINDQNKVLRVVYPGVALKYLIRYENTGDVAAKEVKIIDVIPEQYQVIGLGEQTADTTNKVEMNADALGRTTVTNKIGDLPAGQKGSVKIPVILRADAFGSTDELTAVLDAAKQVVAPAPPTDTTAPAKDSAPAGPSDLQLK